MNHHVMWLLGTELKTLTSEHLSMHHVFSVPHFILNFICNTFQKRLNGVGMKTRPDKDFAQSFWCASAPRPYLAANTVLTSTLHYFIILPILQSIYENPSQPAVPVLKNLPWLYKGLSRQSLQGHSSHVNLGSHCLIISTNVTHPAANTMLTVTASN